MTTRKKKFWMGFEGNGFGIIYKWREVWICVHKELKWGRDDCWYDGPHNVMWVGFVSFYWNWGYNHDIGA